MIGVDGINEVIADFTKAGLLAGVRTAAVLEESGQEIVKEARRLAPKTGLPHYASKIGHDVEVEKGAIVLEVGVERGGQGSLAHLLEFGTSRTPPHAHLGPAFDREIPNTLKNLAEVLGKVD